MNSNRQQDKIEYDQVVRDMQGAITHQLQQHKNGTQPKIIFLQHSKKSYENERPLNTQKNYSP